MKKIAKNSIMKTMNKLNFVKNVEVLHKIWYTNYIIRSYTNYNKNSKFGNSLKTIVRRKRYVKLSNYFICNRNGVCNAEVA